MKRDSFGRLGWERGWGRKLRLRSGDRERTRVIKGCNQKKTVWMQDRVASSPKKYCLAFRNPRAESSR